MHPKNTLVLSKFLSIWLVTFLFYAIELAWIPQVCGKTCSILDQIRLNT